MLVNLFATAISSKAATSTKSGEKKAHVKTANIFKYARLKASLSDLVLSAGKQSLQVRF